MAHLQTLTLPLTERPTLEVTAAAERVVVMPCEPGEVPRVDVFSRHRDLSPVEVQRDGDRVIVASSRSPSAWRWPGAGVVQKLVFFVPAHVRARVTQDFGQLFVERLEGCDLELSASAGTIELTRVRGRLAVKVDSGTITGEHCAGTFEVVSQAGSVKLGIDALDPGEHRIRTSMGSVKLWLAPAVKVKMVANTSLGSTRVSHPSSPDADATLMLNAELGSIRVKTGEAVEDLRHGDWADWRRLWRDVAGRAWSVAMREVPDEPGSRHVPDQELRKVLELVETGKLSAPDAERLIRAMGR